MMVPAIRPADVAGAGLIAGVGLLLLGAAFPFLEDRLIYQPAPSARVTPDSVGLRAEAVWFGPGRRLHGWFVPGAGPVTFLWFNGNAGNAADRLPLVADVQAATGAHFFLFDYPGYGLSPGAPSEAGLIEAGRAALTYLRGRSDLDPRRIVYYGESLGAAVAIDLASTDPPARLILQSGFTSIADLAVDHSPVIPIGWLFRSRYPSIERIGRVWSPVLIVHGERDGAIPVDHARRLFAAANEPKRLEIIPGAGHNDLFWRGDRNLLALIRNFSGAAD